jgi:hypothetical protein
MKKWNKDLKLLFLSLLLSAYHLGYTQTSKTRLLYMEYWNAGKMEYWKGQEQRFQHQSNIPKLQYSLKKSPCTVVWSKTFGYTQSYYVPAVNGTKLAVDVHFPGGNQNRKLPALLEFTRYWRSAEE